MQKITLPLSFFCELILENLPISSSGHITVLSSLFSVLGGDLSSLLNHFAHVFVIITQGFFFMRYFPKMLPLVTRDTALRLFVHFFFMNIITVFCYFAKQSIAFISLPLPFGFFITALFLILIDQIEIGQKNIFSFDWRDALWLGIAQSIAFLPGVSRFGAVLFSSSLRGFGFYDSFFIAIISNIFIAGESFFYLSYYMFFLRSFFFSIAESELVLLLVCLFFSTGLLFLFFFLFKQRKLSFLGIYVFLVGLISFYLFHGNYFLL
jgi:undecaprenyl-diphosphatase